MAFQQVSRFDRNFSAVCRLPRELGVYENSVYQALSLSSSPTREPGNKARLAREVEPYSS